MSKKKAESNPIEVTRDTNRFLLSIAAAKRARQLKDGAKSLLDTNEESPYLLEALEELESGRVKIQMKESKEEDDDILSEIADYDLEGSLAEDAALKAETAEPSSDSDDKQDPNKKKSRSLAA